MGKCCRERRQEGGCTQCDCYDAAGEAPVAQQAVDGSEQEDCHPHHDDFCCKQRYGSFHILGSGEKCAAGGHTSRVRYWV